MKILAMIAFVSVAMLSSSYAQTAQTPSTEVQEKKDKKKIEMSEVPANVQEAFKKGGFTAESTTEIYEVAGKKGKLYKFIVEDEGGKIAVKFDAEGNFAGKEAVKEKVE